jgi:hypothetical protein
MKKTRPFFLTAFLLGGVYGYGIFRVVKQLSIQFPR